MASEGGPGRGAVKQEPDSATPRKFQPKQPQRRRKQPSEVKTEPELDKASISKLLQDANNAANRRGFRGNENKVATTRVAFGSGTGATATMPVGFAKRSSGGGGGGSGGAGGGGGWRGPDKKAAVNPETGEPDRVAKTRIGVLDTVDDSSYKPISLPLRRPMGVGTEFSDDEGDEDGPDRALEDTVPAAKELGLEVESSEERLLFLQLPSILPSSNGDTSLDKFPAGMMGKLRIYESGAIKLQLGDTLMNVYPGMRCVFSQELVAINSNTKKCAFLGDVGQRLVVTPDIDGLLASTT